MKLKRKGIIHTKGIKLFPVVCLFLLTACQSVPSLDKSSMTMGFGEAAFGMGIKSNGSHTEIGRSKLTRWKTNEPVQLIITGEPKKTKLHKKVESQLRKLYQIAAIDLISNPMETTQRLSVEISNETILDSDEITAPCYASFDKYEDGYLAEVSIVITRLSLENETSCLLHEGMHSLGFGGHPHRLNSILSYTAEIDNLTQTDEQLIKLLYSDNYKIRTPVDEVLTTVYNQLPQLPEQKEKRYPPQDISLQLTISESPLVLGNSFLADVSKGFYYQGEKNGASTTRAIYGTYGSGGEFADVVHRKLSTNHVFSDREKLSELIHQYDDTFGTATVRQEGYANHKSGYIKYAITESSKYSCAFTIKYINALTSGVGGHEVMYGHYCRNIKKPVTTDDADEFVSSIKMLDRDPVKIRSTSIALEGKKNRKFSAIRLTGKWPIDGSYISGFKLIIKGNAEGVVKVKIGNEICNGILGRSGPLKTGDWNLECKSNESSGGHYTTRTDESISFRGRTKTTHLDIDWVGDQVF